MWTGSCEAGIRYQDRAAAVYAVGRRFIHVLWLLHAASKHRAPASACFGNACAVCCVLCCVVAAVADMRPQQWVKMGDEELECEVAGVRDAALKHTLQVWYCCVYCCVHCTILRGQLNMGCIVAAFACGFEAPALFCVCGRSTGPYDSADSSGRIHQ